MIKPKKWEVILLGVAIILIYVFVVFIPAQKVKPTFEIPEGATDEYIREYSYKNADAAACEYIKDDAKQQECLEQVAIKQQLDASAAVVKAEFGTSSTEDRMLLGKAMLTKDASLCTGIADENVKVDCLEYVNN